MNKAKKSGAIVSVFIVIGMAFLLLGNQQPPEELIENHVTATEQSYSFSKSIKPIMDNKCLACHACYDAPCQLKLESSQGLARGASKKPVYDGERFQDTPPTRLYVDAQTPQEWRNKGFYSVLSAYTQSKHETSPPLMLQMLTLAKNNPLPINKKVPEEIQLGFDRVNYCPAPTEFADYAEEYPHGGMPLAVSGLDQNEYQILSTWLKQGSKIDSAPVTISKQEQLLMKQWETWLNQPDKKSTLLSRYLYEHLFLGHLYLSDANVNSHELNQSDLHHRGVNRTDINSTDINNTRAKATQFYQLIRSYTPTGEPPVIVATVRPNDDPKKPFFYRLIPIIDTIVHKTHITYRFDSDRLSHYQQLFYTSDWSVENLPGYGYKDRSNPFLTFAAIPAKQRYQFLLDDAEFFVRNFIRGPVCRGQIATNVIRDQFWIMFEDPNVEHYTNNANYQLSVNQHLGLPGEETSLLNFGSQWLRYNEDRNQYLDLRQKAYQQQFPKGPELNHIWDGDKTNNNAFLTVFRHHNSASVTEGWQGEIPLTAWLMGYPLLERTYYELVANFDVFGSISHQTQTRLYFDLIRNGAETNFLRFIPAASRQALYDSWYQSSAIIKTEIAYHELDVKTPSNIPYSRNQPKHELLETLLDKYPALNGGDDPINRCNDGCATQIEDSLHAQVAHAMSKIAAIPASQLAGIKWLPEVSFVRINLDQNPTHTKANENFLVYTLIRNRRHSSVAYLLGESLRYQEELDSLTIMPAPIGSYPNLILQMNLAELDDFVTSFSAIDSAKSFEQFIQRWSLGRMNPQFWNVFHSFKDYLQATRPLEAGIYDMNRYGNW
ncbi:fatty acid cis/trans isomerase [Neptunomonas antarctica]|uniref:Fatty acid cis/trans isomerase (CTI) n=1 Tax=Neptunomonas antarctica TaxID=619304 RepID=A0A1N7N705_9GAMM|nr:fatty acid cis/trans isomerase [Neptunomonas antarctica]SIS94125.1 Fatty acid cis/trans isomerase (CTI) [Neptunomonas antarctica]